MATEDTFYQEIQGSPEESNNNSPSLLSEGIKPMSENDVIFECTIPAKVPKIFHHEEESDKQNTITLFNKLLQNAANNLHLESECTEDNVEKAGISDFIKGRQLNSFEHDVDQGEETVIAKDDSNIILDSIHGNTFHFSHVSHNQREPILISKQSSLQGKQPNISKPVSLQGKQPNISKNPAIQGKLIYISEREALLKQKNNSTCATENNILKSCTENENKKILEEIDDDTDLHVSLADTASQNSETDKTNHQILSDNFSFNCPPLTSPQLPPLTEDSLSLNTDTSVFLAARCHKAVQTFSSGPITTSTIYTGDLVTEDKSNDL